MVGPINDRPPAQNAGALSDEAIELLCNALGSEGIGISGDAARLTGLLKDCARGRFEREIDALVAAVRTGIVATLLELRRQGASVDAMLRKRLNDELGERLSAGDARWAVGAWCAALGFPPVERTRFASPHERSGQARPRVDARISQWRAFALGALLVVMVVAAYDVFRDWFSPTPSRAMTVQISTGNAQRAIAFAPARKTAFALCGSNTIGSQLGPDLARAFLSSLGAPEPLIRGARPGEERVEAVLAGRTLSIPIAAHGSATAFSGLQARTCQIGMASRAIKASEVEALRSLGNMHSPIAEHVIGLDGIAVIVNAANPVSTLSTQQLEAIFTGRATTWAAVGGRARPIAVLARDDKSGTWDTFKTLVLKSRALVPSAHRFEDSATLSSTVATDPDAIGFIGLPYVHAAKALRIASGTTPVAPSVLSVGRETYPLTRRLFVYSAEKPRDPLVDRFISFVESDAGQRIVNRDGFVGTVTSLATSKSNSRSLPSGTSARYRALVDAYDQMNFNFYFNTGSDELDNKALVDVGRLVSLLSAGGNRKSVVLAGFADSTGDPANNVRLSEHRARSAASELREQGIRVKEMLGFGQELPIRDNATIRGREKNRRVEIFLTR